MAAAAGFRTAGAAARVERGVAARPVPRRGVSGRRQLRRFGHRRSEPRRSAGHRYGGRRHGRLDDCGFAGPRRRHLQPSDEIPRRLGARGPGDWRSERRHPSRCRGRQLSVQVDLGLARRWRRDAEGARRLCHGGKAAEPGHRRPGPRRGGRRGAGQCRGKFRLVLPSVRVSRPGRRCVGNSNRLRLAPQSDRVGGGRRERRLVSRHRAHAVLGLRQLRLGRPVEPKRRNAGRCGGDHRAGLAVRRRRGRSGCRWRCGPSPGQRQRPDAGRTAFCRSSSAAPTGASVRRRRTPSRVGTCNWPT